jgi:ATP-dependent metalloprotease
LQVLKAADVNLTAIARGTPGFSGAGLQNLVNIAVLKATDDGAKQVSMTHLEYAKQRISVGSGVRFSISEELKKIIAFHESAHALVAMQGDSVLDVHKITIVPNGESLGMLESIAKNEEMVMSRKNILAELDCIMAGLVAEELFFGKNEVTTGAAGDIRLATYWATQMVTELGMNSKIGLVYHDYLGFPDTVSTETKWLIEVEVREIIETAYDNAESILKRHVREMNALATALLEHGTLYANEVKDIVDEVGLQH